MKYNLTQTSCMFSFNISIITSINSNELHYNTIVPAYYVYAMRT